MSTPKGWPTQEKDDRLPQQFTTIEPIRTLQYGMSTVSHQYVFQVGTDSVEAGSTLNTIVATAHAALKGDVVRFTSGTLSGREVKVIEVATNSITIAETMPSAPVAAVTFEILRHKYPTVNSSGAVNVVATQAPIKFMLDSVEQVVTEDSVTPSNNAPLPVKLTSATGPINITAGDLNVHISHAGATYDSTRIGDGTNLLGINASNEAKVTDATSQGKLDTLIAKDFATSAKQDTGNGSLSSIDGKITACNTGAVTVSSSALPTGASTLSEQQTQTTALGSLLTELQLKADLTETQPVSVSSLPLPTGSSTLAEQQSQTTKLTSLDGKDFATQTTLSALNVKVTACNTGAVTVSSALPAGTNNIGDVDVLTLPSIPAGTNNIGDVDVLTLPSIPSGTNTIGKVDVNTLSVVDLIDTTPVLDTSSTNIAGSGSNPTQIVASLAADVNKIQILDTTGAFIGVYTGAALSEVLKFVFGPGSDQTIEHFIASGTRVSLKRLDSATAISSGMVAINFIG